MTVTIPIEDWSLDPKILERIALAREEVTGEIHGIQLFETLRKNFHVFVEIAKKDFSRGVTQKKLESVFMFINQFIKNFPLKKLYKSSDGVELKRYTDASIEEMFFKRRLLRQAR